MSTRSVRHLPVTAQAITSAGAPVECFKGDSPSRVGMYVQNPPGSGASVEIQFDDTAYGSGLIVEEGQTWYPEGAVPSHSIWVSTNLDVTVRLGQSVLWKV